MLAHGIGGRSDLPIPFALAVAASAFVLVVSFALLAFLWPHASSRRAERPAGCSPLASRGCSTARSLTGRSGWSGSRSSGYVAAAALFGKDDALNPTAGVVYVLFWVGTVAFASALLGPVWRWLNPMRTLYLLGLLAAAARPARGLLPYPEPARLLAGRGRAARVRVARAGRAAARHAAGAERLVRRVLAAVMLMARSCSGRAGSTARDGFQVASQLYGRLSVLGRRRRRTLGPAQPAGRRRLDAGARRGWPPRSA